MKFARDQVLEVLGRSSDGQISIAELSRELRIRHALGAGVEALDLVVALRTDGRVDYDRHREIVSLRDG